MNRADRLRRALTLVFLAALSASPARADFSADGQPPSERVRMNSAKVALNPALRGRWNPLASRPASTTALEADGLPERVLAALRADDALKDGLFRVKVTSRRGDVTLEGVADDEAQRARIEKDARLPGVRSVDNRLAVRPSSRE